MNSTVKNSDISTSKKNALNEPSYESKEENKQAIVFEKHDNNIILGNRHVSKSLKNCTKKNPYVF